MPRFAYRQSMPASCGAAALMCGALELGAATMRARSQWLPLWNRSAALACDLASELRLYSVTGGGQGRPPSPASGYSLPSYIFEAAEALGLNAVAYLPRTTAVGMYLSVVYGSEVTRARSLGMTVEHQWPPKPGQNERLLRVIRNGPDSWYKPAAALHWILERPDGSVMDPAGPQGGHGLGIGLDGSSLAGLIAMRKNQGTAYIDTGIGVMVSTGYAGLDGLQNLFG